MNDDNQPGSVNIQILEEHRSGKMEERQSTISQESIQSTKENNLNDQATIEESRKPILQHFQSFQRHNQKGFIILFWINAL